MKPYTAFKNISLLLIVIIIGCKKENLHEKNNIEIHQIDSLITQAYENGAFNGNVLVAKDNQIIYQKSFGFTDASKQNKLQENSIFNIGSVAKQFNGVAIMMLQERGLLDLDDPVSKFDLGLPNWSKKVTVRHLLNYTSGMARIDKWTTTSDSIAWDVLRNSDTLLFEPGTNFNYDNNGVFLQRRILEKVTGLTFKDFVLENIVKPLDMNTAVFDPGPNYRNRTSGFKSDGTPYDELHFISGWLWQTPLDLYKWFNAMKEHKLISKESFEILLRNPYAKNRTSSLGEYFEGIKLQRHNGTSPGFRSMTLNDFEKNITIILLSNTVSNVLKLGHDVHHILYPSIAKTIKKEIFENVDNGIKKYHTLKKEFPDKYNFNNPRDLNVLGYELLRAGKKEAAIKVFLLATNEFPKNPNTYDSLGEGYLENGQYDLALKNYQKVLALDSTSQNAKQMIQKINNLLKKQKEKD